MSTKRSRKNGGAKKKRRRTTASTRKRRTSARASAMAKPASAVQGRGNGAHRTDHGLYALGDDDDAPPADAPSKAPANDVPADAPPADAPPADEPAGTPALPHDEGEASTAS